MAWAITGAIIMGGMTAMQISAQNEAAAKQQEQINAATTMNYMLKQQQEQELKAAAGMELTQEAIKRVAEQGKIRAAQAESGVAGASPLRELSNSYLQQSLTAGSIVANQEAKQRGMALENANAYLTSVSQWNQLESSKTTGLDALIQVGISAGAGYLTGGAMGGTGGSVLAGGASTGGAAGTLSLGGTTASLTAAESAAMGFVPAGGSFTTTGSLFGLTNQQALMFGQTLGSSSKYYKK